MKMSDVWPSGFSGVDFSYGFYLNAETLGGEKFKATEGTPLCGLIFSHEEPAKATMHAINNHDRLEQENAELREFAKRMINDITGHELDQRKHYWNQELDKLLGKQEG